MSGQRTRFADDHAIEMLRGVRKPNRKAVARTLARRAAWLVKKIETFTNRALDPAASYLVEELAAIAVAGEIVSEVEQLPRDPSAEKESA